MARAAINETERTRRRWDQLASKYDRKVGRFERWLFEGGREWVCSQAAGDVLEVAIGTGRNLEFYPAGIRLVAVDLSPAMLELARRRARELGREIDLREGDAEALPFADESFDTVVCTLSLCSIADARKAVAEMKRVLRPGGRLLLLDHVRSSSRPLRMLQRLLEILSVRFGGDHLTRRPVEEVIGAGFRIERQERSKQGIVERVLARK